MIRYDIDETWELYPTEKHKMVDINLLRMGKNAFCIHPKVLIKSRYTVNSMTSLYLVDDDIAKANLSCSSPEIQVTDFYLATEKTNVSNEFILPVTHSFVIEEEQTRSSFFEDMIEPAKNRWVKFYATNETATGFFYSVGGVVRIPQRLRRNRSTEDMMERIFKDKMITSQKELDALI
jgi:hypothetical protein